MDELSHDKDPEPGDNQGMKAFLFVLVLTSSLTTFAQLRVIGGQTIPGTEAPWQVSLQSRFGTHFCGAVLIQPNLLLTAAHCVWRDDPKSLRIKAGAASGQLASLGSLPSAKEIIIHPDFNPNDVVAHDLAIIVLTSKIKSSPSLQPLPILPENFQHQVDQEFHQMSQYTLKISGWGMTTPPNLLQEPSEKLMGTPLRAVASSNISLLDPSIQKYLKETYDMGENTINRIHSLNSRTLLAEGIDSIAGPCSGDSGGPLVIETPAGQFLLGVSSYTAGGEKQCLGLGVFTNLQAYRDWILQEVAN